jgi:hypothetical protein
MQTPIRRPLLTRLKASAMLMTVRSSRATIGRMPAAAAASIRALEGKQKICSTPSRFRISATASPAFIAPPLRRR